MNDALGDDGWLDHRRESWVWIRDRFIPYPFQNNLRNLPQDLMWECLSGLFDVQSKSGEDRSPENFGDWIDQSFGNGIASCFMRPYNYKVWSYRPEKMAYQWIGERVATTDLKRITRNILFDQDDVSWGPNDTFRFPKRGGTGAIWNAVAAMIPQHHFHLESELCEVDPERKIATIKSGDGTREISYEVMLNTSPLDLFMQKVEGIDPRVVKNAACLLHSSSHIIGIGMVGSPPVHLEDKCWMYFPEDDCPFYRVTVFSNYSPQNAPAGEYWSLMAETSESEDKPENEAGLIDETIQGLINTGLLTESDEIASRWKFSARYAYPTPSLHRDDILREVHPVLEALDIYSRGRFGGWKYEVSNQDHSLMQGVEWANRLVLGVPEITYPRPDVANANYARKQQG
jgi:protoporphyrinogen oxidase